MASVREFPISLVKVDPTTQPRTWLDEEAVGRYLEAIQSGVELPPVVTFFDGEHDWLADGYLRLAAHKRAGRETIKVLRHTGFLADAQWYSYGANKAHGVPLTNADKALAIRAALAHTNGRGLSDALLAEHLGVHVNTIAKYRKEAAAQLPQNVGADAEGSPPPKRVGRDGKSYDTTNIGRRTPVDDSLPDTGGNAPPPDSDTDPLDDEPTEADAQEHDAFWDDPPSESAPPNDEPTPPPSVKLIDGVGGEVPERLWPIFQAKERFDTLCNALSQVKKLAGELAEEEAGAYMKLDLVAADVGNARSQIKNAAPYAVCPYCHAKKGKKPCEACRDLGWVTRLIYDNAPDRDKSKDRKGTRAQ